MRRRIVHYIQRLCIARQCRGRIRARERTVGFAHTNPSHKLETLLKRLFPQLKRLDYAGDNMKESTEVDG